MSTPVRGPDDVKPGDLVRVVCRDRPNFVATVTKAGPDKLTVRSVDGKTSTMAYTVVRLLGVQFGFDIPAIRDRPDDVKAQIDALSAWLRDEPSKEAP